MDLFTLTNVKDLLERAALATHVYVAPTVTWVEAQRDNEIQVVHAGSLYVGDDPRHEVMTIDVAYFQRQRRDQAGRYEKALVDTTASIMKATEVIITVLDGSFLDGTLSVPLLVIREGVTRIDDKYPGLLLKVVSFQGSRIVKREST